VNNNAALDAGYRAEIAHYVGNRPFLTKNSHPIAGESKMLRHTIVANKNRLP